MKKIFIRTVITTPKTKIYEKVVEIEDGIRTIEEAIRAIEDVQNGLSVRLTATAKQETNKDWENERFYFLQQINKDAIEEQLNNIFELKEMLKEEAEKLNEALVYKITKGKPQDEAKGKGIEGITINLPN